MKKILMFSLLSLVVLFSSCQKEEEETVTIDVVSPAEGMTVSDASAVNIQIDFSKSEGDLHDIHIHLKAKGETAEIAPFNPMELHQHVSSLSVNETVDLSSYPSGTMFELEIEACIDHSCDEKTTKTVEFGI